MDAKLKDESFLRLPAKQGKAVDDSQETPFDETAQGSCLAWVISIALCKFPCYVKE